MSGKSITERIRPCEFVFEDQVLIGLARKGSDGDISVYVIIQLLPETMRNRFANKGTAIIIQLKENDPVFCWLKIEDADFSRRLELMAQYAFCKIFTSIHPYLTEPIYWKVTVDGFVQLQRNFSDLKLEVEYTPRPFTMDDLIHSPVLKILDIPVALVVDQEYPIELGDFYMTDDWQIAERQQQGGAE